MKNVKQFIESGILEQYVIGITTPEESLQVEQMLAASAEIRKEIIEIEIVLEQYAQMQAITPDPTIKPFLMATIDYSERMKNGEPPAFPPIINFDSRIEDYGEWINRPDMILPDDFEDFYAKIIGYSPEALTAIVWLRSFAPHEVHHKEFEKFLVLEGTCDITIEDDGTHHLIAGDVLSIPLYKDHAVKVTSDIPCKIILQRIAA